MKRPSLALLSVFLGGCSCAQLTDGLVFKCEEGRCPEGFSCHDGYCLERAGAGGGNGDEDDAGSQGRDGGAGGRGGGSAGAGGGRAGGGVDAGCPAGGPAPTETSCANGVDDDCDGELDCADPDCAPGAGCDDSNLCTQVDRCSDAGTCIGQSPVSCVTTFDGGCRLINGTCNPVTGQCSFGLRPPGVPCATDNNACTADVCSDAGVCLHNPLPGAMCSDGNGCTTGDSCNAVGQCTGTAVVCPDAGECYVNTCVGGACQPSPRPATVFCGTDNNPCTTDRCNGMGACVHTPVADGATCGAVMFDCGGNNRFSMVCRVCDAGTCVLNTGFNGMCAPPCSHADAICPGGPLSCMDAGASAMCTGSPTSDCGASRRCCE